MEFVNRMRQTLETSSLFTVWGPQESGKTVLLRFIVSLIKDSAVVATLKEKVNEWNNLQLPQFTPYFKPEDLVEWGLSAVRHIETARGGQVAPWRNIACQLLSEWNYKTPICEGSNIVEGSLMNWARGEFDKLRSYISLEPPPMSKGGLMIVETYIDLVAVSIARLAGYVDATHLIVDDIVAQLGRFNAASWALLFRNNMRIVYAQQIYHSRDLNALKELATASDAICLTPLRIYERTRWKLWHMSVLRDLRIPIKPKENKYVCIDDKKPYEIPFKDLVQLIS